MLGRIFAEFLFRLQEAILTIPRGITRLMDMLMDREVQMHSCASATFSYSYNLCLS